MTITQVGNAARTVKEAMATRDMTQAELALEVRRSQSMISKFLSGNATISETTARRIAEALGMDFSILWHRIRYEKYQEHRTTLRREYGDILGE